VTKQSKRNGIKMKLINSLDVMESIVNDNKQLSWDGWTVVETFPSEKAYFSKFGIYKNNKWQMKKEFVPSNSGWEIPDKYVKTHG
jgi:hypothetical protein